MTHPERYRARFPTHPVEFAPEHLDLIRRRTMPFMQNAETRKLGDLLAEVYLQGIRDASDALSPSPERRA